MDHDSSQRIKALLKECADVLFLVKTFTALQIAEVMNL